MTGPSQPIFRFAPSPNGPLHLGHAYSAVFTHRWAEALGGTMLLRIEDIDTARSRENFVVAILEDLAWLGLSWTDPVRRQSDHFADYRAAAAQLEAMGLLYPCFCTRAEIRAHADGRADPDGAPMYPGTCKRLTATERAERRAGTPFAMRLDMNGAMRTAGPVEIAETMPTPESPLSQLAADPARWGDVVIVRKDTPTSYHLSVVVDDAIQGVSHVTRGMDLYAATDIHVLLQALLDLPTPFYCHHRLVLDVANEKLAKSKGSTSLAELRASGWTREDVLARLGM